MNRIYELMRIIPDRPPRRRRNGIDTGHNNRDRSRVVTFVVQVITMIKSSPCRKRTDNPPEWYAYYTSDEAVLREREDHKSYTAIEITIGDLFSSSPCPVCETRFRLDSTHNTPQSVSECLLATLSNTRSHCESSMRNQWDF